MEINIEQYAQFQPKQLEAQKTLFNSQCKYLLYGGAAGGGKSYFLRWAAVMLGMYYSGRYGVKHVPIGLFSEDYPTLKDRQIRRIKLEFPRELGELREYRDEGFAFLAKDESFVILLRNLDDPSKYASTEFAAECVEELTKNPVETFEDLRFRLRYPGIPDPKFVGATNPGQIGHAWVKSLWIEPDPRSLDKEHNRFYFVPAKVYDNKYIDKSYVIQLESLPDQKRKAYLDGSWDVFQGQAFTEWNKDTHTVEPFKIPEHWPRYMAMDWGSNKPFAVGWYTINQEGRIYLYRELYMTGLEFEEKYGKPLTASRLAKIVKAINLKAGEKIEYLVADPSMWNDILLGKPQKQGEIEGVSYAEIMGNVGLPMLKGDNDRENGMARFREVLSLAPDGLPWYQVFNTCYHTIRTIPALIYDIHRVEDVDTDGEDHAYDRDRYFFMSRPTPAQAKSMVKPTPIQTDYQRRIAKLKGEENEQTEEWEAW